MLLDHVKAAKFPYWQEIIHLFVGGSALHGAKVEGYDDLDIYGVYVEPPEKIIGIDSYEHFVWSTSANDQKNGKDDVDITLYGLQKWANLACKGNPSILHSLFAESVLTNPNGSDTWFHAVRKYREAFLCKKHAKQFLGFASAQLMRMMAPRRYSTYGLCGSVPFGVSVLPCGGGQFGWQPPSVLGRRGGLVVVESGFFFGGGVVDPGGFAPGPTPPVACA